jgi:hypothetical protein
LGGVNTYSYVDSDPLVRIDPDGRSWAVVGKAVAGAAINFSLQLLVNYEANGGDLEKAFKCVNLTSVGVAGAVSTVLPGFGSVSWTALKYATGWFGGASIDQVASSAGQFGLIGAPWKFGLGHAIGPHRIDPDCDCKDSGILGALHQIIY